jgi:hypothetical protein
MTRRGDGAGDVCKRQQLLWRREHKHYRSWLSAATGSKESQGVICFFDGVARTAVSADLCFFSNVDVHPRVIAFTFKPTVSTQVFMLLLKPTGYRFRQFVT